MNLFNQPDALTQEQWIWLAKITGAVSGSAVSLAYMLPKGKREAAVRFAVGLICGMIFGGAAGVKIAEHLTLSNSLGQAELMLMGSAAASFAAWTALGFFKRFTDRLKNQIGGSVPQEGERDEG
ncbi:DUF6107 family protein [Pseudochrobactrum saccharolyticum]|uniref:DUF6107 family protein n=1 Tax=Pseudochrobactrum saccharolyticum TaxID=354352 RepID=UPI002764E4B5|nr:DUF6107 family protein [Pseudochrobactrum saccharolyticum]MDP8251419.1 hypothetical protein [Pseudochrobactrum saccharolyticum]